MTVSSSSKSTTRSRQPIPASAPTASKTYTTHDFSQLIVACCSSVLVSLLYFALPDKISIGPQWLIAALTGIIVLILIAGLILHERMNVHYLIHFSVYALMAIDSLAVVGSLVLLMTHLPSFPSGKELLKPAILLWSCMVLVFSLWYWRVDGGGPIHRRHSGHIAGDFLFPQQANGNQGTWAAGFVDYLFLAFCSATALSPADVQPLSQRAKLLMMVEAVMSMLILVLLVARSVNIL